MDDLKEKSISRYSKGENIDSIAESKRKKSRIYDLIGGEGTYIEKVEKSEYKFYKNGKIVYVWKYDDNTQSSFPFFKEIILALDYYDDILIDVDMMLDLSEDIKKF